MFRSLAVPGLGTLQVGERGTPGWVRRRLAMRCSDRPMLASSNSRTSANSPAALLFSQSPPAAAPTIIPDAERIVGSDWPRSRRLASTLFRKRSARCLRLKMLRLHQPDMLLAKLRKDG